MDAAAFVAPLLVMNARRCREWRIAAPVRLRAAVKKCAREESHRPGRWVGRWVNLRARMYQWSEASPASRGVRESVSAQTHFVRRVDSRCAGPGADTAAFLT